MSPTIVGQHDWQIVAALPLSTHLVPSTDTIGTRARKEAWTTRAHRSADSRRSMIDNHLRIKEGTRCVVRRAVSSELVSGDFPVKQGKYREFRRFRAVSPRYRPQKRWIQADLLPNSLRFGTGNLIAVSGKICDGTGIWASLLGCIRLVPNRP